MLWLLLVFASIISLPVYVADAQQVRGPPGLLYLEPYSLYSSFYAELSIQAIIAASIPGKGVVAASGFDTASKLYSLEVLSIDSSSGAIYRSKYAVSGAPTAMASDGDYGSYIAVGSSRGEAIVYNAQDGGVSYIQASRYSVKRLSIGVGASGDPYLAVLDSQGYLYLYRATRGGWAEVGPHRSTAVYDYARAFVLDISGTEVIHAGQSSVDPSLLLVLYKPPSIRVTFLIYNETGYPISNAVATAHLIEPKTSIDLAFQAVSNVNGIATLDLPLIDPGSTVYVTDITHPDYETQRISVKLSQDMLERAQVVYTVTMKRGLGVVAPIIETPKLSYAALLDASSAPESIRFGKPLLLTIEPLFIKLIKPDVRGVPWTYLGVIIGCCREGQPVIAFTYFDRDLNPVPVSIEGYVWYTLPAVNRTWVGYDDSGRGVSAILDSGRIYNFLYNDQRGFHTAFWGIDIPGSIASADYRNGALIAVDSSGMLHINRVNPGASIECTRSYSYFGVPVGGPSLAAWAGPGSGYLVTQSRVYVIKALSSITSERCPIELVRILPRALIADIASNYSLNIGDGYIDIYEKGSLVARSPAINGSSVFYLPRGSYIARVSSSVVEYAKEIVVGGSSTDLLGPTLYKVGITLYYYNPESLYTVTTARVPPGLTLSIDNRTNVTTADSPIEILLEGGSHTASLIYSGVELASTVFTVSRSGNIDLILRVNTARINVSLSAPDVGIPIPQDSVSLKLIADGPLLKGDLGGIKPGIVTLPLGFYRISASSQFFYGKEIPVILSHTGLTENAEISLKPSGFQARLVVIDEFGSPVPNAGVTLRDKSGNTVFSGPTDANGLAVIPGILLGEYLVMIRPANTTLYMGYNGTIRIDRQDLSIIINRTRWNVTISPIDQMSGAIISPVRLSLYIKDTLVYVANISPGTRAVNATLPHGSVTIVIEPVGSNNVYDRANISTTINAGGGQVSITLTRRYAEYSVRVVNDLNQPLQGASISVKSIENPSIEVDQVTDSSGAASFRVPVGLYSVRVSAIGYNELATRAELLAEKQSVVISLQPTLIDLLQRYTLVYIAVGLVIATLFIARRVTSYLRRRAEEEII